MKGGVTDAGTKRLAVVPFDSANKFMATLNEAGDGAHAILVKGAPDRLSPSSSSRVGLRAAARTRSPWPLSSSIAASQNDRSTGSEPSPPRCVSDRSSSRSGAPLTRIAWAPSPARPQAHA
jgi:magnesium-transporting ATPase (P-type)